MSVDPNRALRRSIGTAKLDIPTFEEVEADQSATTEAGVVLVVASIIGSIGLFFTNGLWGFITSIIVLVLGWYVWSWVSAFIAERLFNVQTTNMGEMQRTIGYASGVRAIGIVPFLGFVALIWTLVASVVAIRQAGEMTTIQAIITAVLGWIPTVIALGVATAIL